MGVLDQSARYHLAQLGTLDSHNKVLTMGKVLSEDNDPLADMPIYPGTEKMGYKGVRESSLPTPQIIKVGDGWDASKAEWDPFTETISMFKDRIAIPRDALRIQPNPGQKRELIRGRHIEGFGQGVANHLIYGTSTATPEKFDGLSVRYTTPDASNPINPTNGDYGVYDMGGSGSDTSSIFLIQWAEDKVCGLSPMNDAQAGLRMEDKGLQYVDAENSKKRWDYIDELEWDIGLKVEDYRAVARIRNIESALTAIDADLWKKLVEARNNFKGKETVWAYTNSKIFTHLDILTAQKNNVRYSSNNPYGKPLLMFRDMPIRRCDALLETETAVAAA
jgi:hypothetical protein